MSEKQKLTLGRQSRNYLLLPIVIACAALLASCGGGSDSTSTAESVDGTKEALAVSGATGVPPGWTGRAPKMEVINGIIVPPEPAPSINNATLAGVDVNANGVRDDVERKIAIASANQNNFAAGIVVAKAYQRLLTSGNIRQVDVDAAFAEMICALHKGDVSINDRDIMKMILDNNNRKSSYRSKVANLSGAAFNPSKSCR